MWYVASETWVDIFEYPEGREGRFVDFISESGVLDMFVMSSTRGPKHIMNKLASIAGYPALP